MTVKPNGRDTTRGTTVTSATFAPTMPRARAQNQGLQTTGGSGTWSLRPGDCDAVIAASVRGLQAVASCCARHKPPQHVTPARRHNAGNDPAAGLSANRGIVCAYYGLC